jgi:O-antigen/teichoic acid export membrane protein/glycosyltransferase involved in cell wall biosynthesis
MNASSHWPISILATLAAFVNLLLPLVLVRLVTPAEVGMSKIFFLYLAIMPALSFTTGISNGLSYWAGQPGLRDRAVRISGLLILLASFGFLVAGALFYPVLAHALGWGESVALLFALALFGTLAGTFFEDAAIASGKVWKGALFLSGFEMARTLVIVSVAAATRSLSAIFLAHATMVTIKAVTGYVMARREGLFAFGWDREAFTGVARYAMPVSLSWAIGIFVNYADQLLLSPLIPPDQFAFYAIGCLSVPPLTILEHSITRVLIPQMSRAFAVSSDRASPEAARLYRDAVGELGFLVIPAVAGMIVFATPIMELLFTEAYSSAAGYLKFFALSYLALLIPYDSLARARGEARWILANHVVFSILTLAICGLLIVPFGAWGALAGLLVSRAAMRTYAIHYARSSTGWALGDFLPLRSLAEFAAVAAGLGLASLAVRPFFDSGLRWFLVCGSFFTVAYFAIALALGRRRQASGPAGRVVMLTQYLGIGGLERMILNLSDRYQRGAEQGQVKWTPSVFVFDHPKGITSELHLLPSFEARQIEVETFTKPSGFSGAAAIAIARHCRARRAEVIHTHDLGALIYGVIAKWLLLGRIRLVHTQHSFVHINRKKRYVLYERFFTFFADQLCVVSEETKATYVSLGIPAARIAVVPNGVEFPEKAVAGRAARAANRRELLSELAGSGSAKFHDSSQFVSDLWVLYMARLHNRKGQEHAIALWSKLAPEVRRKLVLSFVGAETEQGQLEKLRGLIAGAPDRERIHYFGSTQTPRKWLVSADIYLSCSEFEGMPLGPVEAGGAGLPLLLSDIPGHSLLREISRQYPLDEPERGARQLEAWVSSVEIPGEEHGRVLWQRSEFLRKSFSLEAMAGKYAALYRRGE